MNNIDAGAPARPATPSAVASSSMSVCRGATGRPRPSRSALLKSGRRAGLEQLEMGRQFLSNDDFAERLGASGGNITHVDMAMGRAGPMRPARGLGGYRTPVDGLYLSGAGTHPGGGVTGAPGYVNARVVIGNPGALRGGRDAATQARALPRRLDRGDRRDVDSVAKHPDRLAGVEYDGDKPLLDRVAQPSEVAGVGGWGVAPALISIATTEPVASSRMRSISRRPSRARRCSIRARELPTSSSGHIWAATKVSSSRPRGGPSRVAPRLSIASVAASRPGSASNSLRPFRKALASVGRPRRQIGE